MCRSPPLRQLRIQYVVAFNFRIIISDNSGVARILIAGAPCSYVIIIIT